MFDLRWSLLLIIVAVCSFDTIESSPTTKFRYTDIHGPTRLSNFILKNLESDVKDIVKPLHVDMIPGKFMQNLTFVLSNATMTGIKDCDVVSVSHGEDIIHYSYIMQCPQLVFNYDYEVKGNFNEREYNLAGSSAAVADDYVITFHQVIDVLFIHYKQYRMSPQVQLRLGDYNVETDLRGKFSFENDTLTRGDKAIFNHLKFYVNDNWREIDSILTPMLESFLGELIKLLQKNAALIPMENFIPLKRIIP